MKQLMRELLPSADAAGFVHLSLPFNAEPPLSVCVWDERMGVLAIYFLGTPGARKEPRTLILLREGETMPDVREKVFIGAVMRVSGPPTFVFDVVQL